MRITSILMAVVLSHILSLDLFPTNAPAVHAQPADAPVASQLFFPFVVKTDGGEALEEFDFLQGYVSAYKIAQNQMTLFNQWRQNVWSNRPVDITYYRTICNSAAVAEMVRHDDPDNPNADSARAKAILLAALDEYDNNPYTTVGPEAKDGWGYPTPNNDSVLNFDTGFVGYPCTLAAALLWDKFNSTEKTRVRGVLESLATRIYQYQSINYFNSASAVFVCGNSPAEEASAYASFLAAMSQFDRDHALAAAWRTRAQQLMDYAFNKTDSNSLNIRTHCSTPPNGGNYANTVTNHSMYPHSIYGFSVLNDVARTLLPWRAQGIQLNRNPVTDISNLDPSTGNDQLYGEGWDAASSNAVYYASLTYVNGANPNGAIVDDDFTLRGTTYNAYNFNNSIDFRQKSYLGTTGVSDWGFGADFQNGAFAFLAWVDMTVPPSLGNFYYNYENLRAYQATRGAGDGYFPSVHANGCDGPIQTTLANWQWAFLPAACNARMNGVLVPFFENTGNYSLSNQVNAHFFLNSFSAFNHLVAYIYMRSSLWPPTASGTSTLPNFTN